MIKRFKEYLEYKRKVRMIKLELLNIASTTLPNLKKGSDVVNFTVNLIDSCKGLTNRELIEMVLSELSTAFQTNNQRLIEVLSYMAQLSYDDMQKILTHSISETLDIDK